MMEPKKKTHFEEFLESQTNAPKPTPNQVTWARERFSSRVNPPKTTP